MNKPTTRELIEKLLSIKSKPAEIVKAASIQPINIVNDIEQPMVVVHVPRIKSQKQVMHRDANGDIAYTITEYEYE